MTRTIGATNKPCKVCGHDNMEGIEEFLLRGIPHKEVIGLFPGLTARDLQKHVNDHMTVRPAIVRAEVEDEIAQTTRFVAESPTDPKAMHQYMLDQLFRSSQRLSGLAEITGSIKAEEALTKVADSYLRYVLSMSNIVSSEPMAPLEVFIRMAVPDSD